jgi:hypothetical protein
MHTFYYIKDDSNNIAYVSESNLILDAVRRFFLPCPYLGSSRMKDVSMKKRRDDLWIFRRNATGRNRRSRHDLCFKDPRQPVNVNYNIASISR